MAGNHFTGVISITEPARQAPVRPEKWGALLRLGFHDIDTTKLTEDENKEIAGEKKYTLFDNEHAHRILQWLDKYDDTLKAIYVHCAMGISRSAAVVTFLAAKYGLEINRAKASSYNRRVYRVLYDEWTKDPKIREQILAQAFGRNKDN
jgi:predicted protein tyrosine phosphatase